MRSTLKTAAVLTLLGALVPVLLAAQEVPRRHFSPPFGLTEQSVARVLIAPMPLRLQGPQNLCLAEVTVEFLDPIDLTVLATFGPTVVGIGNGFQADFSPEPGPPPARQEVVVRTTIERTPGRAIERGATARVCPLTHSIQVLDPADGRTLQTIPLAFYADFVDGRIWAFL